MAKEKLSPTARKLKSVSARMRKIRTELAGLVLIERGLIVEVIDIEGATMPQVCKLCGITARQQVFAMYQKGKGLV